MIWTDDAFCARKKELFLRKLISKGSKFCAMYVVIVKAETTKKKFLLKSNEKGVIEMEEFIVKCLSCGVVAKCYQFGMYYLCSQPSAICKTHCIRRELLKVSSTLCPACLEKKKETWQWWGCLEKAKRHRSSFDC